MDRLEAKYRLQTIQQRDGPCLDRPEAKYRLQAIQAEVLIFRSCVPISPRGDKEGTTERVTYLVVVGEDHKDSVVGSFSTLEDAQSALAAYRDSHRGTYSRPAPLSWIEQSVRTLTLVPTGS